MKESYEILSSSSSTVVSAEGSTDVEHWNIENINLKNIEIFGAKKYSM